MVQCIEIPFTHKNGVAGHRTIRSISILANTLKVHFSQNDLDGFNMRLYQRRNSVSKQAILYIYVYVWYTFMCMWGRAHTWLCAHALFGAFACGGQRQMSSSLIMFHLMYEAGSLAGTQSSLLWLVQLAVLLQGALPLPTMHLSCPDHHTCATHYLDASDPNSGPHTVSSALTPHNHRPGPRRDTVFKKKSFKFLWCNIKIYISTMSERAVV